MSTIYSPAREQRGNMESPNDYPVTYALSAVRDNSNKNIVNWDSTAWAYQLYPISKPSPRNNSDAKSINLSGQSRFGTLRAVSQERRPTQGPLLGKSFDSVRFEASNSSESKVDLDVIFLITRRDYVVDLKNDSDITLNDRGVTRDFYRSDKEKTVVSRRDGIIIETFESGDDLIMPNGPGGIFYETGFATIARYPKVDRKPTFVNSGAGEDVIVGGYASDFFGGTKAESLWKVLTNSISQRGRNDTSQLLKPALDNQGSKLMIGGSNDDALIGGLDEDYLVGDRLARGGWIPISGTLAGLRYDEVSAELFLPILKNKWIDRRGNVIDLGNMPGFLKKHVALIGEYQPAMHYAFPSNKVGLNRSALDLSNGNRFNDGDLNGYQLWFPGNDFINGGRGDDMIFGDDSSKYGAGASLSPLSTMKAWADAVNSNNGKAKLTDDERKAGVTWTDSFLSGANDPAWGSDFLIGDRGDDMIYAGFGGDAIIGGGGSDLIDFGAQILVKGYRPFYGTKVAFGDNAEFDNSLNKWIPSERINPDQFIIPDLFTDKNDLRIASSRSAFEGDIQSARDDYLSSLEAFKRKWDTAGGIISKIPLFGEVITNLVDGITTVLGYFVPDPPDYSKIDASGPQSMDYMTIIRDFDDSDIFTIRTEKRDILRLSNGLTTQSDKNPLFDKPDDIYNKDGTGLEVRSSDKWYSRVFLEGYTGKLAVLGSSNTTFEVNGVIKTYTNWTVGGKSYLETGEFEEFLGKS